MTQDKSHISAIELVEYFYPSAHLDALENNTGRDIDEQDLGYETDIRVSLARSEDDPRLYRVTLLVFLEEVEGMFKPYDMEVTVMGLFRVAEGYSEDKELEMVGVAGPNILYSAARDYVYSLTMRGPYPPIRLPIRSFPPPGTRGADQAGSSDPAEQAERPDSIDPADK